MTILMTRGGVPLSQETGMIKVIKQYSYYDVGEESVVTLQSTPYSKYTGRG